MSKENSNKIITSIMLRVKRKELTMHEVYGIAMELQRLYINWLTEHNVKRLWRATLAVSKKKREDM